VVHNLEGLVTSSFASASLQFLGLHGSQSLKGHVNDSTAADCYLQLVPPDELHPEIGIQNVFFSMSSGQQKVIYLTPSNTQSINETNLYLTLVAQAKIPLSVPEIGIHLGTKVERLRVQLQKNNSGIQVSSTRTLSGRTIGDSSYSLNCLF
jgi:hypothetical protein